MLPNADRAFVDPTKIRDYLLSTTHPVGRFKAAFFRSLGYASDDWERLRDDLLDAAHTLPALPGQPSPFGDKFELRATLAGPAGRSEDVVTVWIVLFGEDFPRFVTAFPESP